MHPIMLTGMPHKYTKETEVLQVSESLFSSFAPACCDISMLTPVPIPRNTHKITSTGCELVPTAAMEVWSQYLLITSVSTVVYRYCKIFPSIMGSAKSTTLNIMLPFVISIFFFVFILHPLNPFLLHKVYNTYKYISFLFLPLFI